MSKHEMKNVSARFFVSGEPYAVRQVLIDSAEYLRRAGVGDHDGRSAQIVLAEVLNNVVEHAFAHRADGLIEIGVSVEPDGLHFSVTDDGVAMPEGHLPHPTVHDLGVGFASLPEGGWGWALIRELSENLEYERKRNRNCLTFVIPHQQPE